MAVPRLRFLDELCGTGPTAIHCVSRLVLNHLHTIRKIRKVGLYGHHPIVQNLPGSLLRHRAAAPYHMVVGMAVRFDQPFTNGEVKPLIMIAARVVVGAGTQHGNGGHPAVATQVSTTLVGTPDCSYAADGSVGNVVRILVVAANPLVQV